MHPASRAMREVALLDERDPKATHREVAGDAGPGRPTPNDNHVRFLRHTTPYTATAFTSSKVPQRRVNNRVVSAVGAFRPA